MIIITIIGYDTVMMMTTNHYRLQRIQRSAFRSLTNLIKLDLRCDPLIIIKIIILAIIKTIKSVIIITISITITKGNLMTNTYGVKHCHTFVFSHNSLKFIPGYSFSHVPQLRWLSLSSQSSSFILIVDDFISINMFFFFSCNSSSILIVDDFV